MYMHRRLQEQELKTSHDVDLGTRDGEQLTVDAPYVHRPDRTIQK